MVTEVKTHYSPISRFPDDNSSAVSYISMKGHRGQNKAHFGPILLFPCDNLSGVLFHEKLMP